MPPVADPAASTGNPAVDATTNLEHTVAVAPSLTKAPAAALDVATAGGDITSSAQATALQGHRHVAAQTAAVTQQSQPDHPGGLWGMLGDLGHRAAHDVEAVADDPVKILELPLAAMNVGMKESQHQFRYLYDVYQRHGLMAALGETFAMMAAGAAGVAVTAAGIIGTPFTGGASDVAAGAADAALAGVAVGGEDLAAGAATGAAEDVATGAAETGLKAGAKSLLKKGFEFQNKLHLPTEAILPAQAVGYAESHTIYTDSWNRTANPQYKNKDGVLVNPGNILDGLLGLKGFAGSAMSGVANGIFDLTTDPSFAAASDYSDARNATSDVVKFGKVYNRSIDSDNLLRVYDAALAQEKVKAGTATAEEAAMAATSPRQDNDFLSAVDWMAANNGTDIARRFPQFEPLVNTVSKAGEDPLPNEELVSRYDKSLRPMDPTHPQGAYGTSEGSPSSYAVTGGDRSEFFIDKTPRYRLETTTSPTADPEGWNAGTAAIEKLAGPAELHRLTAIARSYKGAEKLVDIINEKWPELHLPYTNSGQELDVYGAQLARDAGYKSIHYTSKVPGYGD